jgi:hypothetical protein
MSAAANRDGDMLEGEKAVLAFPKHGEWRSHVQNARRALRRYPSCAENPAVQGGDVERGERSSPCAKIFS